MLRAPRILGQVAALICLAFMVVGAKAHEIRPGLAEVSFPDGRWQIAFMLNLEAMIAGVGPEHEDTDDSPVAAAYNDLRADPHQQRIETDMGSTAVRNAWAEMEAELGRMREHFGRLPHSPTEERKTGIAETLIEDMAALGYLDGEKDPGFRALHLPWELGPLPKLPVPPGG